MAFNVLQPTPLWMPCYWGTFFIAAHSFQIARILRERSDVTMSEREHEVYERCFMGFGFTPRMFLQLMRDADAKWVTVDAGTPLACHTGDSELLHIVTGARDGGCVLVTQQEEDEGASPPQQQHESLRRFISQTDVVCRIDPVALSTGVWVGDIWRDDERRAWQGSAHAADGALEAVRFDAPKFHAAVRALGPRAVEAAEKMQIAALKAERAHGHSWHTRLAQRSRERLRELEVEHLRERNAATYEAMVALAVSDGVLAPADRRACEAFRAAHGISDQRHREALARAGWLRKTLSGWSSGQHDVLPAQREAAGREGCEAAAAGAEHEGLLRRVSRVE